MPNKSYNDMTPKDLTEMNVQQAGELMQYRLAYLEGHVEGIHRKDARMALEFISFLTGCVCQLERERNEALASYARSEAKVVEQAQLIDVLVAELKAHRQDSM